MCFSQLLEREQWKPAEVSTQLQKIVEDFAQSGKLRFNAEMDSIQSSSRTTPEPLQNGLNAEFLVVDNENFIVVG